MAKNQNNNVAPATQKTEPGAKKDALATALAQIEKQFGKGAIMKLGDNTAMQVDAISTGVSSRSTAPNPPVKRRWRCTSWRRRRKRAARWPSSTSSTPSIRPMPPHWA